MANFKTKIFRFCFFMLIIINPVNGNGSIVKFDSVDFSLLAEHYQMKRTPEPELYITGVNFDSILNKHLPDFNIIRDELLWKRGRRYRLIRYGKNDQMIEIAIGIFSSVRKTEENVIEYFKSISGIPQYGVASGTNIGDNSWFLKSGGAKHGTIIFIRKNTLIVISGQDYNLAESVATKIDKDLIAGTSGVEIGPFIKQPKIEEITFNSKTTIIKEKIPIIIHAKDPQGQKLQYFILVNDRSGFKYDTENPEEKILIFDKPGKHKISIFTINESNVISEIKDIEIECDEN